MRFPSHALLAMALLATVARSQSIDVDGYIPSSGAFLTEGKPAQLRANDLERTNLRAIYRPGSNVTETEELGATTESLSWTPKYAGLVELQAYAAGTDPDGEPTETVRAKKVLSVRFATAVPIGLFLMIGAGLLLFGGAALSIRALLRA